MRRQPYTPCKLFVDGIRRLKVGQFLLTQTRRGVGSAYLVQAMRQSPTRPERRYLDCVRWPIEAIPHGAIVYRLSWYRR